MNLTVELIETDSNKSRITLTPTRTTVKVGLRDHERGLTALAVGALIRERMGEITRSWRGSLHFQPGQDAIAVTVIDSSGGQQRHVLDMADVEREEGAYA
jgi:hypothetical protein